MENITKAILLAGSVLLFVMGFSYSMFLITKLSTTSKQVLESVTTVDYYDNLEVTDESASSRIVGIDTIISTLYRYYKENYCVKIFDKGNNLIQLFDTSIESRCNLDEMKKSIYCNKDEEAYLFGAPWISSVDYAAQRVSYFLNGTKGYINNVMVDYSRFSSSKTFSNDGGFIANFGNSEFDETFTEFRYAGETISTEDGIETLTGSTQEKNKIVITYKERESN